ncbi:hypothetical protein AcW1_007787 [Taiwanofungus camphoratus]|nr:hypothetical protein AcV5_007494 [Antrodia cinnamomea]KAI0953614.1 hypothetical protein AcW1_007787 [Antrodia cinnamomea]
MRTAKNEVVLFQIGSALIFGPALIYVLSPPSQKAAHDTAHSHKGSKGTDGSTPFPVKDDEGTEVSAASVETSEQDAFDADAPKDAQAAEEKPSEQAPMTDDEGTSISGEEAKESMKQAFNADAPADAQAEEEKQGKYTSGAPGQTAEAESKPDQNEKPSRSAHTGSLQSDEDSGPTNMGDARKTAKSGEAPKEASED